MTRIIGASSCSLAATHPQRRLRYIPPTLLLLALAALFCHASVPVDLSNFQNEFVCDPSVRIVRPNTVEDVQAAVRTHARVKAVGEGHSWNEPFFCSDPKSAPAGGSTANIVMTTLRPLSITVNEEAGTVTVDAGVKTIDLLSYLANYVTKSAPAGWTLPAFPWFVYQSIGGAVATGTHGSSLPWASLSNQVLEITAVVANGTLHTFSSQSDPFLMKAMRVSVGQLGVITSLKLRIVREQPVRRTLVRLATTEYLDLLKAAQQHYLKAGDFPGWLNETEFFWITQRNEFLMVSFTRGDVADAALRHEVLSQYTPQNTTIYNTTLSLLQDSDIQDVLDLPLLEGVTFGNVLPSGVDTVNASADVSGVGIANAAQPVLDSLNHTVINAPPPLQQFSGPAEGATTLKAVTGTSSAAVEGTSWQVPEPLEPVGFYAWDSMAAGYLDISRAGVMSIAANATVEPSVAYLYQPREVLEGLRSTPYDQYEVAFPMSRMLGCWEGLLDLVYHGDLDGNNETLVAADKGFRTAPLIRLLGQEEGLLAYSHDGPVMLLNIEDYIFYNADRQVNELFRAVMGYLRSDARCGFAVDLSVSGTDAGLSSNITRAHGGRLHFGKAGWPERGCWHGDTEYSSTWCDFGCAVQELDPTNKFTDSAPDRWTWQGVDLDRCCSHLGFNNPPQEGCVCKVQHERSLDECPPPPFYTER